LRTRLSIRTVGPVLAVAIAAIVAVAVTAPANAAPLPRFRVVGLIADQAGHAPLVDPKLVNPWGLALSPTGPLWVANNGTDSATVYSGGVNGATPTKVPLTVAVVGGRPTGQVFNGTDAFVIQRNNVTGKALFIFCSESGNITAWNPTVTGNNAEIVAHVDGAIYKGLAILRVGSTVLLLAADFHNGRIDVLDASFHRMPALSRSFTDPKLPAGFAPFNVVTAPGGGGVYVAYAKQDADREDEVAGVGLGFVDRFDGLSGKAVRIASRGTLNAPWGMAIAPASFGGFAGALLVGNFGDGRIGVYRDHFLGFLHGTSPARPIEIDGLWALQPGTATTGGAGTLWFSAGPDDEEHGLVGEIVVMRTA
jgi:uncharacterized protein (TIGR03118 family)